MSELIEGKVAQILSDNCVVLNIGIGAGARVGMIFVALAQGEEVKDPETGVLLGRWEIPKGYLRATHVQEWLTTCEGYAPGGRNAPDDPSTDVLSAALITHSMHPESWREKGGHLNVDRSQVSGMPKIGPISVGDTVREFRPAQEPQTESASAPERPKEKTT